jgi:EAL domain-containing protein (putative c-di-GMP-specific phosphodiesterase class I)
MYQAKEQGRNCYHAFTEALSANAIHAMTLESGLRRALDRKEFVVHYQPRVDIKSGRILGSEALVRWQHPDYGLVSPNKFISLAEETGLIGPISEYVLQTACEQTKAWMEAGCGPLSVSVNISGKQFQQRKLTHSVKQALMSSGLEPQYLDLELTESILMGDSESVRQALEEFREMGVSISVDDFGTGYSSLSYLKRFPVDAVKIDRSFVTDITTNPDDAAIAGAVVAMAHSLKLKVCAEGVETIEQLEFLRSLQCDEMQGYFISPPISAQELDELLWQNRNRDAIKRMAA